ncbi:hypothetical protein KIH75_10005 [Bifidobacterium sp. 64T4]|uniref:hypothetical protein n=1 Tax=Bifidobacterium pongonis TaxID=2834432 RepID=UPI001C598276|nr:hypothetical protein [Bifidobacterium pongonis]MBW3095652.1 hypothetical protein [Bifidobacterium pongonis]
MASMAEKEMEASVVEAGQTAQDDAAKASQGASRTAAKEHRDTPETAPESFTDPITVPVTLSEGQAEHHHVPKDFVYECSCYPHTSNAGFEVVLPDGCRANTWSHISDAGHNHKFLVFAIALRLDLKLRDEGCRAEVFPEYERLRKLRHEAFEARRAEYRRTHPDVSAQPMKVTLIHI